MFVCRMAARQYQKFLRLMEAWPLPKDALPGTRDLGQHLKLKAQTVFQRPDVDLAKWEGIHDSLQRICDNRYLRAYQRDHNSTAFGLSKQEIREKFEEIADSEVESDDKSHDGKS